MHSRLYDISEQIQSAPILIVDDNEINRIFLERTLKSRGFTHLLSVASGEEALEKLQSFNPAIVILDIMMPGIDGYECCAAIRRLPQFQSLPVLIQTSLTEPELRVKAFGVGATDFVSKPIYPDELVARVVVHLERRQAINTLELYKQRVEVELESARQLQFAILPGHEDIAGIENECGLDIACYFQPSSEIGGDFYGVKSLQAQKAALWTVDFSGHGVAPALNAFRLQAYTKQHSPLETRPGDYMSDLNDKLLHLLMRGHFATMVYGVIDTSTDSFSYACASTPSPLIARASNGKTEIIDGSGSPLGVITNRYPTQRTGFYAGDTLLLYSDALVETPDAKGRFIVEAELAALLEKCAPMPASKIKDEVLACFTRHSNQPLADDLTIIICKRRA